jgi:hypothetical protein
MRPYVVPEGIKVLVAKSDLVKARSIVEDFVKNSTI